MNGSMFDDESKEGEIRHNPGSFRCDNKSLKWIEAEEILTSFNPLTDVFVSELPKANGGEMYIFFTADESKYCNYTTDRLFSNSRYF